MPTRKQRRRRQKGLRHEYEYVYVDEEGQEVEVDEDESARPAKSAARRNGKGDPARAKPATSRPGRKIDPPSWQRVMKRAALFAPVIFIAFSVLNHQSLATRVALTAAYTAFFIPFMYLLDRAMYRAYLRRSGNAPARGERRR